MRVLKFFFLALALLSACFPTTLVRAQSTNPDEIFVSQTGHFVKGGFLQVYHSIPDYVSVFGYPLTDEIIDPTNGRTVQYFQRARFDLIKNDRGLEVEIAPLGKLLYQSDGETRPELSNSNKCRRFDNTGKSVCLAFLDYFDSHDGLRYFGEPVSDFEIHDGLLVQYFEKVRMEWHPERPAGQKVSLTDLGRIYFDTRVGDPVLLEPAPVNNLIGESTRISVKAFVNKSLVGVNELQTVYMVVQDQYLNPIQGAGINVILTLPDGKQEIFRPMPTNLDGISRLEMPVKDSPLFSIVNIQVVADYQKMQTSATTWYRVW